MRLNDTIPGLPEWPFIDRSDDGREITVHARHISLDRWRLTKWLFRIAGVWALYALCKHTYETQPKTLIMIPILVLGLYAIIANGFPTVRLVTWLLFRRNTVVHFTAETITVSGKAYGISPDLDIQFRAHRPTLPHNRQHQAERYSAARYQLEFRTVEMIYGMRVVPITSIANEERAEQFAIALQLALQLIDSGQPAEKKSVVLPE